MYHPLDNPEAFIRRRAVPVIGQPKAAKPRKPGAKSARARRRPEKHGMHRH